MNKDAADVIQDGVRKVQPQSSTTDLTRAAAIVLAASQHAEMMNYALTARDYQALSGRLRARHDHADPCEIGSDCPCCKAGLDYARDNIEPPCKR